VKDEVPSPLGSKGTMAPTLPCGGSAGQTITLVQRAGGHLARRFGAPIGARLGPGPC
jgi:hypothetical protein